MSAKALRSWSTRGYLDALRPEPDSEVDFAILATYSADPVSIVAALLALVGRDDEDRPPAKRDLADAVEALRGRVRVVVQRGRLATMARTPRLAGVLDQFIREVGFDERIRSWHPKAALVCMRRGQDRTWRLWIGSRNLTASENLDLGLLLVGDPAGRGRVIEGAGEIAETLATHAALEGVAPARIGVDVAKLRWRAPPGIRVRQLRMSRGDARWPLPTLPKAVDALTVVSPFLDAGFLNHLARVACRGGSKTLLSSGGEIERLAASTRRFGELFALDAPDYPDPAPVAEGEGDAAVVQTALEGEEIGRGLHAKILHLREGERRRLWVGSANATRRAWTGRNAEIIAELSVDASIEEGLLGLVLEARPVVLPDVEDVRDVEPDRDRLDLARAEVSALWQGQLVWDHCGLRLRHPTPPHPADTEISLEAGLLTGDLVRWPVGVQELDLGDVEKADRTELVQLRLTLDGRACTWIVHAPATPPFGIDRDRAAFMRQMGARQFLLWIADLLRGAEAGSDGPPWTDETTTSAPMDAGVLLLTDGLPTLEEILSAWAKDPACFERVRRRVRDYLPALLEQTGSLDPEGHRQLTRFDQLWETLESGLGVPR
jgi:hypothetical protein